MNPCTHCVNTHVLAVVTGWTAGRQTSTCTCSISLKFSIKMCFQNFRMGEVQYYTIEMEVALSVDG